MGELKTFIPKKEDGNEFPVELFPQVMQDLVNEANRSLKFNKDFLMSSMLFATSVAIGQTHRVKAKDGWETSASLWLAIVGKTGANKTAPFNMGIKPIQNTQDESFSKYERELKQYNRDVADKDTDTTDFNIPTWNQQLIKDITIESFVDVMNSNMRGLGIQANELGSWLDNIDSYGKSQNATKWLDAWDGEGVTVNRVSKAPTNVPNTFVSVLGGVQPTKVYGQFKNLIDNGFMHRFLFVRPKGLKTESASNLKFDTKYLKEWEKVLIKLNSMVQDYDAIGRVKPTIVPLSNEALAIFIESTEASASRVNQPRFQYEKGTEAKIRTYVLRFALIFEMLDYATDSSYKMEVSAENIRKALRLAEYFYATSLDTLDSFGQTPYEKLDENKQVFYSSLGSTFKTSEANEIGEEQGISVSAVRRFLKSKDLFSSSSHGEWSKV